MSLQTPLTELLHLKHPILLAGMNVAAGPKLAAAVTNAGGLGVIGGVTYTPEMLEEQLKVLKEHLNDPKAPFGVDLLLPEVSKTARKTNYDYTKGKLDELVDVVIKSGAALFVSAVGVPPKSVVDKLHAANIPVMNMIGHPKHVAKALAAGVDIICAQGGEGGGHTGTVPFSILIPKVVELCKGKKSPLWGKQVPVVAAGGVYRGSSLAAALMYGADAVWVGTVFICANEAGAPKAHQEAVMTASFDDTIKTLIFTGRPLRVRKNPYIMDWEDNKKSEIKNLTGQGIIPAEHDLDKRMSDDTLTDEMMDQARPFLMGKVAAVVDEIRPASQIIQEMVDEASDRLKSASKFFKQSSKL